MTCIGIIDVGLIRKNKELVKLHNCKICNIEGKD
jgi:hypothetical protein